MVTAMLILNLSLTLALEAQTPIEGLTRSKPIVDFFRVFGCLSYRLVDSHQLTKFDAKSKLCVLIG